MIRGLGVGIVPAATRGGQRNLFTVGAVPEVAKPWSSYAPSRRSRLPDGSVKLSTKFTRLTGRSPILLAGMTPTTVDAKIVAAAANAGHWAELAGGGQVTEEIFDNRIAELHARCSSRAARSSSTRCSSTRTCGSCRSAASGWCRRPASRARRSTASSSAPASPTSKRPSSSSTSSTSVGITHVVFKPGTVEQIRSVIRIAAEVPTKPVIVHIEGGRAGGHHSWEDLDDLLLATYSELRSRSNITVCVGGGIGTPERAAEYLSGRWAAGLRLPADAGRRHPGRHRRDGHLEATTSPSVKQMLVETGGTDHWIGAGKAQGGMASGRSQLGADIHEIDNAASRCGRLLDEVAGDADAVAARRDEIIAAMADTAKPYFGDVGEMTYLQWLQRYVELAIGDGDSTADTAAPGSPWLADTWRDRFAEMLQRAEARLHPKDFGPIETLFDPTRRCWRSRSEAIAALLAPLPRRRRPIQLHPADVPFFVELCKTLGKPVNFVPVIDKDVRRWWRSDSLWQAHDARYDRRPGVHHPGHRRPSPASPASTSRSASCSTGSSRPPIDEVLASAPSPSGGLPPPGAHRRHRPAGRRAGLARRAVGRPHRDQPGAPHRRAVRVAGQRKPQRHKPIPPVRGWSCRSDDTVMLSVPLSGIWIEIRFTLPSRTVDGGTPVVTVEDASTAMRAVLAIAAGVDGPDASAGGAGQHHSVTVAWDPEQVADHTGVTATFGAPLAPDADRRARRARRPLLARGVRGHRLGRHRRRLPGRRGPAEPGAPRPRRAPAHPAAEDASRIDRHRNGFGGHRHRGRPRRSGDGHHHRRRRHRAGRRWRSASRSAAAPVPPSSPTRCAPGGAMTDNATDTPRRRRRDVTVTAPVRHARVRGGLR